MKRWIAKCPSCERTVESCVLGDQFVVVEHGTCTPKKVREAKLAPMTLAEAHALVRATKG